MEETDKICIWSKQRILFHKSIIDKHKWGLHQALTGKESADKAVKINGINLRKHAGKGKIWLN